jgi:hypothetical protein
MSKNKSKRKMGECTCDNCGVKFEKPLSEITRNNNLGRQNFCSRTCVGKNNTKNFGDRKNNYDISKHSNNSRDKFTGLRSFLRRIKNKYHNYDVDLVYLKEVWDNQHRCVYTGVELVLPKWRGINDPLYTASIDRIDSNKGYIKGNLQFISIAANLAKNAMTHEQMLKFCKLIIENKKPIV